MLFLIVDELTSNKLKRDITNLHSKIVSILWRANVVPIDFKVGYRLFLSYLICWIIMENKKALYDVYSCLKGGKGWNMLLKLITVNFLLLLLSKVNSSNKSIFYCCFIVFAINWAVFSGASRGNIWPPVIVFNWMHLFNLAKRLKKLGGQTSVCSA